jgi:hypothetical protein
MRRGFTIALALLLSLLFLASCATPRTTTTTTTTVVECEEPEDDSGDQEAADTRKCTTISEETAVSHRPPQCHGILSCGFYVTGEAIALPFRALGMLLDVVF